MRLLLTPAALLLSACAAAPDPQQPDLSAPTFPVMSFFEGRTEGSGVLKVAMRSPQPISVQSHGRIGAGETLSVHQTIVEGDKPARTREWRIREVAPGRYSGTLSDASGPVTGEATGNRLHLTFRMNGGLDAEQWLTLAPDGRSARNVMIVRKFGLTVATLEETIRKVD